MLPRFPKSEKLAWETFNKRIFAARARASPASMGISQLKVPEGRTNDYQRVDGEIRPLDLKLHRVEGTFDFSDGKGLLSLDALLARADGIGEKLGTEESRELLNAMSEATQETGNVVVVEDGKLTQEVYLKLISIPEENFDENGQSTSQLFLGAEMLETFKRFELENVHDKAFQEQIAAIKEQKRAAFDQREARRRLVA